MLDHCVRSTDNATLAPGKSVEPNAGTEAVGHLAARDDRIADTDIEPSTSPDRRRHRDVLDAVSMWRQRRIPLPR